MIIFRYLIGEVFRAQLAVFVILTTIIISQRFVKILADASEGEIPGQLVMSIVALKMPQLAVIILPLSAFLGILVAYGRVYADSEMTVLHATGVSEWYVTRLTLLLSIIMALLAGAVTLYLSPWATEREYQLLERAESDAGLFSFVPGRFQHTSNEKAVIFVQEVSRSGGQLAKVFVAQSSGKEGDLGHAIVYAEGGAVVEDPQTGAQVLQLKQGRRYAGDAQSPAYEVTEFGSYHMQIREQQAEQRRRKLSSLATPALLQENSAEAAAEWHWRIAIPLSIPILTLIAVPLARVNPRQGKFGRLLPALLLYLGYYALLIIARSAIEDGKIPPQWGMWWLHISGLTVGCILILRNRASAQKLRAWLAGR
ncbi:LPS export ABC transporter permease LptF [Alishewanella tabrizica]|uniref:Lipopolysaccharide export system permease protein LptF n=1 Tax=Alishewanella tabrizica TaxID=671278 RepID=A0ABQ2WHS1_9ALTE|nr:LPS export ABC transporter permease LptF [Alishewanella tabrizica]GGW51850.1 LPS export ABC transporter permease LptF [Alishewanella tabrizica]